MILQTHRKTGLTFRANERPVTGKLNNLPMNLNWNRAEEKIFLSLSLLLSWTERRGKKQISPFHDRILFFSQENSPLSTLRVKKEEEEEEEGKK